MFHINVLLQGANGFLIVYDVTNGPSFTKAEQMLKELDMCGAETGAKNTHRKQGGVYHSMNVFIFELIYLILSANQTCWPELQ